MTKSHLSRKYMTPVTVPGTGNRIIGYVASCRDCGWRQVVSTPERRNLIAIRHQEENMTNQLSDNELLRIVTKIKQWLRNNGGQTTSQLGVDLIIARQEGQSIDPELDEELDLLPEVDSDTYILMTEAGNWSGIYHALKTA